MIKLQVKFSMFFLLIMGIVILSLLLGVYHYQKNVIAVRGQAERLFVKTLTDEIANRQKELNLPVWSSTVKADTIPLAIHITTATGTKMYNVNAEKSRKNISQHTSMRVLHSAICEKKPLLVDTIQMRWAAALHAHRVDGKVAVCVSAATLAQDTGTTVSPYAFDFHSYPVSFISYIGARCEIEVIGLLHYSCWSVFFYDWYSFLWIVAGGLLSALFFYALTHRPPEMKIVQKEAPCPVVIEKEVIREVVVEKELIREVVIEKEVPHFVKVFDSVTQHTYQLCPGLYFDYRRQILLSNGEESALAPQSCAILKLFLDAPNHTMNDNALLKNLWGNDKTATVKRFTVAYSRLSGSLKSVGFIVHFKRVGTNQYRMLFAEY